jgi:hypothetical protein
MLPFVLFVALIGCRVFQKSPESVYSTFKEACDTDDIATAESLVTQEGIDESKDYTVCILMPDGIARVSGTNQFQLEDPEPEVKVSGNTAYLTWWTATHRIEMTIYNKDGNWKIRTTMIYDR